MGRNLGLGSLGLAVGLAYCWPCFYFASAINSSISVLLFWKVNFQIGYKGFFLILLKKRKNYKKIILNLKKTAEDRKKPRLPSPLFRHLRRIF
jgi:hypothetical protein